MANTAARTTDRDDLINDVKERLNAPSKAAAEAAIVAVLGAITGALATNGKDSKWSMRVHELGTFKVVNVKAKVGRNPSTGETKNIPARTKIKLTLTKALRDLGK